MNLDEAIAEEINRVNAFKTWYLKMNSQEPDKFPLDLPKNNTGLWFEMIADFASSDAEES
jgi:hypothetical protein